LFESAASFVEEGVLTLIVALSRPAGNTSGLGIL